MAFWEPQQLQELTIDRMIFHVVGPDEDQLQLLEEVAPGPYGDFFLERIKSTNNGMMFDFIEGSVVLSSLKSITADRSRFVRQSGKMAEHFKLGHGQQTSVGVFMVFHLSSGTEKSFALLKYDHEEVLSYVVRQRKPRIRALHDTFVKSPEALQKSALIRLSEDGGELCVRDRVQPTKIGQYFQAFLGAKRRFAAADLTEKLYDISRKVAKQHAGELGSEVMSGFNARVYQAIQRQQGFDPEDREPFMAAVFGSLPQDSKVRTSFDKALRNARIESEAFEFDRAAVRRPPKRRIVTQEGIQIIWDRQFEQNIRREQIAGGRTEITIVTGGVKEEDDYPEQSS
jgi:hypothetical protein